MRIKRILFQPIFLVISIGLFAQPFDGGFNFNLPYDDSTMVEFLPQFSQKPIEESDFISAGNSGQFLRNGEPIRFFGGNCTTQGAFPTKQDAGKVAARMRKMGINIIRFHHIDNPWSNGSLFHGVNGTRNFNTSLLDRLDYFIYQLKQNGIYVNMNLNVSRTFENSDGVEATDSLSDYAKGITLFNRQMIELQKEYAQKLLGHVNPYTGIPLARDPALGMVEIVNENSLFRRWYGGDLRPISEGGTLPKVYADELDNLWHSFLIEKYDSTATLEEAWSAGKISGDTLFTDDFENGLNTQIWQMEEHAGAEATFELNTDNENSAVVVETIQNGSESWHITFKNVGNSVKKDSIYELHFRAKADAEFTFSAGFQRNNSPWTYYGGTNFPVDTEYKNYKVTFKAPEDNNGNLRIWFRFDFNLGKFYIDDVVFKVASKNGLEVNERLEAGNVKRVSSGEIHGYSQQRIKDLTEFYTQTQIDFLNEMKTWLKDSLGVRAPLAGTNWFVGPEDAYVQNTLDYIDNHSYWDHPQFPNQPWSPTDWKVNNVPMMTNPGTTIENLFSGLQVNGKPYTVSEYNHGYPNQFQSEMLPIITSYLSFNGADGIMFFTYSGSWDWDADALNGYFDLHRNHSIMSGFPIYSYVFRNGLIEESPVERIVNYRKSDILEMPLNMENSWGTHIPYSKKLSYNNRIEVTFNEDEPFNVDKLPTPTSGPYSLNNGQIYWDKNGLFKINTSKFAALSGNLIEQAGAETEMLKLKSGSGFGSVSWLSLVDSALHVSSKSVIYVGSKQQNSGMQWDGNNTVHNNWGHSPTKIAPIQMELKLKNQSAGFKVTPLNIKGEPVLAKTKYFVTDETGHSNVSINLAEDQTVWYAVKSVSDWSTTGISKKIEINNQLVCYPNPSDDVIHFKIRNGGLQLFNLSVYDFTGRLVYSGADRNEYTVSSSDTGKGIFIYKAVWGENSETGKIILYD